MNSYKLKNLIKIHNGTKYSHLGAGKIPLYGSGGLMGYVNKHLFDGEAILLPRKGTLTNIMYVNEKFWSVDTMYYATANKDIDTYYLYRYLSLLNLECLDSGSALPSMTKSAYNEIKVDLPEFEIQKKVSILLKTIDNKIELNTKINAELEKMAKTLYDYWFVQFDFPDENGKPYKSSGGKMVFSKELKREIPEGWEVGRISDLLPVLTGKEDANFATENGEYNFFTCGEDILKCDEYKFEGKAILIAGNGNFNIKLYEGKFNAYQRTYVLIPKNEEHYTVIYLAIKDRIKVFISGSRGSIVKFITKGDIENIKAPLPKNNFSQKYKALNDITKKIEINIKENQKLAELRDWLLPMLMNGQVEVGLVHASKMSSRP